MTISEGKMWIFLSLIGTGLILSGSALLGSALLF
jgi:hypothetical protein